MVLFRCANPSVPDTEHDIHHDQDGENVIISDIVSAQNKTIADAKKLQNVIQQRIDTVHREVKVSKGELKMNKNSPNIKDSHLELINKMLSEMERCAEWNVGLVKLMDDVSEQQQNLAEIAASNTIQNEHVQDQILALQLGNEFNESTRSIDSESTAELQRPLDHAENIFIEREIRELIIEQLGMIQYEMETMIEEKNRDTASLRRSVNTPQKQRETLSVEQDDAVKQVRVSLTTMDKVFAYPVLTLLMLFALTISLVHVASVWVQDGAYITERLNAVTQRSRFWIVYWSRIIIGRDAVQSWMMKLQDEIQSKHLVIDALESALQEQKSEKEAVIAGAKLVNGFYCAIITMLAMAYITKRRPEQRWNFSYASDVHGTLRNGAGVIAEYFNKRTNQKNRYPLLKFLFIVAVLCTIHNVRGNL